MFKSRALFVSFFGIVLLISKSYAQSESTTNDPTPNPPVNMEVMFGTRGANYQLIINKKFKSVPKLGFFSVTNGTASWKKEMLPDIMTQAHITYSLIKGFDISGGMQYSPVYGYRPVASLIYTYASPDFLMILFPKVDLQKDLASEVMALFEYKPKLNPTLKMYNRVQGLYGFVPESGIHNRSYIVLRSGVSYKEFTFGAGANFDWYSPMKHSEKSLGVFINILLF